MSHGLYSHDSSARRQFISSRRRCPVPSPAVRPAIHAQSKGKSYRTGTDWYRVGGAMNILKGRRWLPEITQCVALCDVDSG